MQPRFQRVILMLATLAPQAAREVAAMVQEMTGFEIFEVSFRELHEPNIQQGIDAAFKWEGLHEQDPKRLASSFEQEIRVVIVEAVTHEH